MSTDLGIGLSGYHHRLKLGKVAVPRYPAGGNYILGHVNPNKRIARMLTAKYPLGMRTEGARRGALGWLLVNVWNCQ